MPDSYLDTDIILRCDVLRQAKFSWEASGRTISCGGTDYLVNHMSFRWKSLSCENRSSSLDEPQKYTLTDQLLQPVRAEPYQSAFMSVPLKVAVSVPTSKRTPKTVHINMIKVSIIYPSNEIILLRVSQYVNEKFVRYKEINILLYV